MPDTQAALDGKGRIIGIKGQISGLLANSFPPNVAYYDVPPVLVEQLGQPPGIVMCQ